jgi:hypothetical protein
VKRSVINHALSAKRHTALYTSGSELATDAHSRASTSFKEYRLITCVASSWRIPRISIYPFANANS